MNAQQVLVKKSSVAKPSIAAETFNDIIVDAIQDIKGKNIVKLDLRKLYDAPTDYFIICEGDSNVQVRAITDSIYRRVKAEKSIAPNHIEGGLQSTWIVMDYFDVVVHVFHRDTRGFYELEDLWSDASLTEYVNLD